MRRGVNEADQKIVKKRVRLGLAARSALFFAVFWPLISFASVKITDVMYDAPGSDAGHEWIKITTDTPVDLSGYRLFEGGTNHKLSVAQGTTTLMAGESAYIVADPSQFLADHPTKETLFKSSFTLSNTGETISLKDSKLAVVDTYSYQAPPPAPKIPPAPKPAAKKVVEIKSSSQVAQAAAPETPRSTPWFLYGAGVLSLLAVGVSSVLVATSYKPKETPLLADEFDIE